MRHGETGNLRNSRECEREGDRVSGFREMRLELNFRSHAPDWERFDARGYPAGLKTVKCPPVIRSGSISDLPNVASSRRVGLGGDGGRHHGVGFEHAMDSGNWGIHIHGTGSHIQISSGDNFESSRSLNGDDAG